MAYNEDMRGVLFKNDKKETENQPDYTGHITIGGVKSRLAAWIKTPNAGGAKFMSIAVSAFDASGNLNKQAPTTPEDDSDIMF